MIYNREELVLVCLCESLKSSISKRLYNITGLRKWSHVNTWPSANSNRRANWCTVGFLIQGKNKSWLIFCNSRSLVLSATQISVVLYINALDLIRYYFDRKTSYTVQILFKVCDKHNLTLNIQIKQKKQPPDMVMVSLRRRNLKIHGRSLQCFTVL